VTTTVPSGETALSLSGSGWTCNLAAITTPYNLPADSCYRTDSWGYAAELPAITLAVSVAPNATTPETETATISGGGELVAPIAVGFNTTIQQSADLNVALSHNGSFNQGDAADTYSLTVSNVVGPNSTSGGASLGQVVVTDTAPTGETITGMSGNGWSCSLTPVIIPVGNPNLVLPADSCARSDALAVNASYPPITVTVSVADGAGSPLVNSATVTGGGMSAASTANGGQSATDSTTVNPEPDLRVLASQATSSVSGTFTQGDGPGAGDQLLITIHNQGFAPTNGTVTVTDTVPSGLTPVSPVGSGWGCSATGQTVTCTRGDALAAGVGYPTIVIPVTVADDASASATNNINVSGGGEIEAQDDTYHQPLGITQLPDMQIALSDSGPFQRGDVGDTYSIAVFNGALVASSGQVSVTASLGSGLSATAIGGSGWTCDLPSLTCTRSDALGGNNAVYPTITVTVNVSPNASGSISSSATVSGGGEVNAANDTATDTTLVPHALVLQQGSGQNGSSQQVLSSAEARPRALTVNVARAGRRGYVVSGRLMLPRGVTRARGCAGLVTVDVSHAKRTLSSRRTRISRTCTYTVAGSLGLRTRVRHLTITARFHGNPALAPTIGRHTT
jgi:hypothetical protein